MWFSGKTTILKQMKRKYRTDEQKKAERLNFKDLIRKQILDIICALCKESIEQKQKLTEELDTARLKFAKDFNEQKSDVSTDIEDIEKLWKEASFFSKIF